jgi:hypothetical protein
MPIEVGCRSIGEVVMNNSGRWSIEQAQTWHARATAHLRLVFQQHGVSCVSWGLVAGKTQTIFQWGNEPTGEEPPVWFHEIFRPDGSAYDDHEVTFIRGMLGQLAGEA